MLLFYFIKQKTAYDMRISDWSSDVCSSDLLILRYCEAQTHELAAIDRIMVDARSCRHAGFEQQFAAEGQAVGAEIADVAINIKEIGRASCRERVCRYE